MDEFDKLTGLYTRAAFCRHAEEMIKNNPDISYDIVLSDFVNFKLFNERFGVKAGDLLLAKTGEMLASNPMSLCGRYGGDRFVSLVPHLNEFGRAILEQFALPEQAKNELPVDSVVVKFGICENVDLQLPLPVYCDRAYTAVQAIKHQYGKIVAIYEERFLKLEMQEVLIEENMKKALENEEYQVYYQPKIDIETEKICGAEALVRWNSPVLGFMSPGIFIPLFEKNDFITSLDMYVWEKVCQDISGWKKTGLKPVPISTNVSRKDFNDDRLSEKIAEIVDKYDIDHDLFHLEVTETSYADKSECVAKHISALHDNGFKIELDDFGAGYTSLASLNNLAIDILKLDMSLLTSDVPESGRSVLDFAMQLAKILNIKTVQEGVETAEQLDRLKALGCTRVQGYYYSKPLPKSEFETFLKEHE